MKLYLLLFMLLVGCGDALTCYDSPTEWSFKPIGYEANNVYVITNFELIPNHEVCIGNYIVVRKSELRIGKYFSNVKVDMSDNPNIVRNFNEVQNQDLTIELQFEYKFVWEGEYWRYNGYKLI